MQSRRGLATLALQFRQLDLDAENCVMGCKIETTTTPGLALFIGVSLMIIYLETR